jgi:hypothetical protein
LPDIFHHLATQRLAAHPGLAHEWSGPDHKGKRILIIPEVEESGFDIRIDCETYGLYPYAGGWHGAPWDADRPKATLEEICEDCLGFIRSVVSPEAVLTVTYAGAKPIRWVLSYPWRGTRTNDETGLLLFNYFAPRQRRIFQNHHLPPRGTDNVRSLPKQ